MRAGLGDMAAILSVSGYCYLVADLPAGASPSLPESVKSVMLSHLADIYQAPEPCEA